MPREFRENRPRIRTSPAVLPTQATHLHRQSCRPDPLLDHAATTAEKWYEKPFDIRLRLRLCESFLLVSELSECCLALMSIFKSLPLCLPMSPTTSAVETPKKRSDKRVTSSRSPRSASKHLSNAPLSPITALAPRYTSSGAPQAGPTQDQSPRVLAPTTMAGSPNFPSLDGAVLDITAAAIEERSEIVEKECQLRTEELYGEDGFIKFKVHASKKARDVVLNFPSLCKSWTFFFFSLPWIMDHLLHCLSTF
ncbi:hypothetical protein MSAN_01651100 [Mycena sanguinolenta]|uniref:Uncharacterized protein n=1 Tax=Mycena sanguinolenta TaxID=230812 RepID=A0A8H7CUL9_9AGAR|nr:hypothetical protein MSAN_01651100 [Mycena sanguinolenta]